MAMNIITLDENDQMKIVEMKKDPFHDEIQAELDEECQAIMTQYRDAKHYTDQLDQIPESLKSSLNGFTDDEFNLN